MFLSQRRKQSLDGLPVITDELLCQLHMKIILDGLVLQAGSVVLVQHKCIGNSDIEQKVKDILVELSTCRTFYFSSCSYNNL